MKRARSHKPCGALMVELSKYLEGDLTRAQCRSIERHLESCADCTTTVGQIRKLIAECRATKKQQLPDAVRLRAQARIKAILDG